MGFDGWWHCTKCEARGPGLNNKFCAAYTHKSWKGTHSDHTDQNDDEEYPGQRVRQDVYNRMVGNHKDKFSQQQEEAEAIKKRKVGPSARICAR
eukprot:7461830-Heterocapsa_arctica.AAC.1